MKRTIVADTIDKAREIAKNQYPSWYYITGRKVGEHEYEIILKRRKRFPQQKRRLIEFYKDEIKKNKKLLFSSPRMNVIKKVQDRIRFYEEKLGELKSK